MPVRSNTTTLAGKLGTTIHFSVLLRKAQKLGLRGTRDLERLLVIEICRLTRIFRQIVELRPRPVNAKLYGGFWEVLREIETLSI